MLLEDAVLLGHKMVIRVLQYVEVHICMFKTAKQLTQHGAVLQPFMFTTTVLLRLLMDKGTPQNLVSNLQEQIVVTQNVVQTIAVVSQSDSQSIDNVCNVHVASKTDETALALNDTSFLTC